MTGLPSPLLLNPSIHAHLIPTLALLHAKCIIDPPHSGGTFLAPLDTTVMETWWASRVAEVSEGFREIIVQFGGQDTEEVVGVVMLSMPVSATAAFKGYVEKLCVSTSFRGRGIARRLVDMLCDVAVERGRPLLVSGICCISRCAGIDDGIDVGH